ncbi:uridine kinase [archaeon]|nr:MAG: uridine kinase [archaeon]
MAEELDFLMNETYDRLAREILDVWEQKKASGCHQLLVGFAAPPGAGKSTTVMQLCKRIPHSIPLPMDGYHYTKKQLGEFEDPVEAFRRRGANWTFDAANFVLDLQKLRDTGSGSFPSFDHAIGDPKYNDILINPEEHQIVLIEGNYLLLDIYPWSTIKGLLDVSYFIDCEYSILEKRVVSRHISVGRTPEEAQARFTNNDGPNASLILQNKNRADKVFQSK